MHWSEYIVDSSQKLLSLPSLHSTHTHTHTHTQDGQLSKEEIGDWVMPEDYDHAKAEAKHLIHEADINKVCHT